jgi:hypothetical protein
MTGNHRSTRILLGVIAFLLAANLLVALRPVSTALAAGGIPDSGAQLQQQIDQLTDLNKKVDRLSSFLESGKLVVDVKEKEKAK